MEGEGVEKPMHVLLYNYNKKQTYFDISIKTQIVFRESAAFFTAFNKASGVEPSTHQ